MVRLFDIVDMERETQAAAFCGGSDHHLNTDTLKRFFTTIDFDLVKQVG